MWMRAPTPVTSSSIVFVRSSRTKPSGTERTDRSSQVSSSAWISGVANTTQLPAKLASTATTEMRLLRPGHDFVNRTMTSAENNGRSKIYQGSALISRSTGFQPVWPAGILPAIQERNRQDACLPHRQDARAPVRGCSFSPSSKFQRADVFDMGRLAGPIKRDDDREADRHFRRRDRDDEENKY